MDYIYISTLCFFFAIIITIRAGLYLPAFFFLCYMLPFLPILAAIDGGNSTFWTGTRFTFPSTSLEVVALSQVWLASSLGVVIGVFLARVRIIMFDGNNIHRSSNNAPSMAVQPILLRPSRIFIVFVLSAVLVLGRFLGLISNETSVVHSGEMMTCVMLLLCWTIALFTKRKSLLLLAILFTGMYTLSQVITGKRDFFLVGIALVLLIATRHPRKQYMLFLIGLVGLVLVLAGAVLSMTRMDVPVTFGGIIEFISFNSWNATILPVILMIEDEWKRGFFLYGKSYLDLLFSVIPSPIFEMFGMLKPIQADNPATWFYITGLGGMHAAGVALRNFGLAGVFIQSFLFMFLLSKFERMFRKKPSVWNTFLYLCLAGAIMHTVWYGLVYMVNTIVLFLILYTLFSIYYLPAVSSRQRVIDFSSEFQLPRKGL